MAAENKNRTERKRSVKLAALAEEMAISAATVDALRVKLASLLKPTPTPPPPPTPPKSYQFVPRMPTPLTWAKEEELKDKVLRGLVPTAVADASASSNYDATPLVSDCGGFEVKNDPFIGTGIRSDKVFRDAGGRLNPASEVKLAPIDLRPPANKVHMVPDFKGNLFSTSKFVDAGYAWKFDQDKVGVYDTTNTKNTTSRVAVMKGWHVPGENVWRFPLQTEDGVPLESRTSPQELLRSQPPPVRNVCKLRTKPELVRYYHAAAGFPTKPTWIAAIKNGHYKTWPGLNQKDVAKYFPNSTEMWRGHGRKIKSGQRSTRQPVKEEEDAPDLPTSEGERAIFLQTYNLQHDFDKKLYLD